LNPRRISFSLLALCLLVLAAAVSSGCNKQQATAEVGPTAATNAPPAVPAVTALADSGSPAPKPDINGNRVMQYVKEIVAFGSRPPGSSGHAKLEQYIHSKLKGVDVENDTFTAKTPVGAFPMNNIIAKFPGKKDGIIVVAGHYDTVYHLKNFVGANDGGSSTALLLALADQFRGKPLARSRTLPGWDDGGRG